jgi:hypothetical protein
MELIAFELPQVPTKAEQNLVELADYYRQLVTYHQKISEEAKSQLVHIEVLLSSIKEKKKTHLQNGKTTLSFSQYQSKESTAGTTINSKTISDSLPLTANNTKVKNSKEIPIKTTPNKITKTEVEKNKNQIKAKNNSLQINQEKPIQQKTKAVETQSRLPKREKMAKFSTTVSAVSQCLQENHPQAMSSSQILNWIYPKGLKEEEKKDAYQAISNCLVKNSGKRGWERTSVGKYVWTRKS